MHSLTSAMCWPSSRTVRASRLRSLFSDARAALPLSSFDATPFSLDAQEDACVRFAEDALVAVTATIAECDRRLAAAQGALDAFSAADEARPIA